MMYGKLLCTYDAKSTIEEGRGPMNLQYICAISASEETQMTKMHHKIIYQKCILKDTYLANNYDQQSIFAQMKAYQLHGETQLQSEFFLLSFSADHP